MTISLNTHHVAFAASGPQQTPTLSLILGYGATLPFVAGAAGAALIHDAAFLRLCLDTLILWGAAILLFLAAVRRGLIFRTPGDAAGHIAASLWYFGAGCGSLLLWALSGQVGSLGPSISLLLAGYASLILLDMGTIRRLEASPYFALRQIQVLVPIASLCFVLMASRI